VTINGDFTPQTFSGVMLESTHNWQAVNRYMDLILATREEERERQRGPPADMV